MNNRVVYKLANHALFISYNNEEYIIPYRSIVGLTLTDTGTVEIHNINKQMSLFIQEFCGKNELYDKLSLRLLNHE